MMGLFRRGRGTRAEDIALEPEPSPSRLGVSDNQSIKSLSRVTRRLQLQPSRSSSSSDSSAPSHLPQPSLLPRRKRNSTVVEAPPHLQNVNSRNTSDSASYDSYDSDESDCSTDSAQSSLPDIQEHLHPFKFIKPQLRRLTAQIMGLCQITHSDLSLRQAAQQELRRTFSLLDAGLKIHRLPPGSINTDSVIGDSQARLISELSAKLIDYYHHPDRASNIFKATRTLHDRYGVVTKVLGRGTYGVIKIVDSSLDDNCRRRENDEKTESLHLQEQPRHLYAVKEIQKRRPAEEFKVFIERVISEFVISSTLALDHIVQSVDLMITLSQPLKFSQVMECTPGGNLLSYLQEPNHANGTSVTYMALEEVDCIIKQVARGLLYMHQHGVAHCDLKLENILLLYVDTDEESHAKLLVKLSDFGKSNVFRTKWDAEEQLFPTKSGPLGSEPFMAPEEFSLLHSHISLRKKDCWALGIVMVVLFNVRRFYYLKTKDMSLMTCKMADVNGRDQTDLDSDSADENGNDPDSRYWSCYFWRTTDTRKRHLHLHERKYRDTNFEAYVNTRMIADYHSDTKEWLVKKPAAFRGIQDLFRCGRDLSEPVKAAIGDTVEDDLCELRMMNIYKLLDLDPQTRMSVVDFLKGDYMSAVDLCLDD